MLSDKLLELSLVGSEWVLWTLVGLSVLSLWVIVDRLTLFVRTRDNLADIEPALFAALGDGRLDLARRAVAADSLVRNVLRAGLDAMARGATSPGPVEQAMTGALARERSRYGKRLTVLGTIGNNAPFVGLFGTVLGIIEAFHEMGRFSSAAAQAAGNQQIMAAIGAALVATGVGILVAIPAVAAFNWAKAHVADRARAAEALMRAVLAGMNDGVPAQAPARTEAA